MIACVDVAYRDAGAVAACLWFERWTDAEPAGEKVDLIAAEAVAPYASGAFYLRELPCLLAVLRGVDAACVVIDGYVWLDGGRPGLGARLHEALGGSVVVGVAKTRFRGADASEVLRGRSRRPLFVTAVGMDREAAGRQVAEMHGAARIPTLLLRVDQLARR